MTKIGLIGFGTVGQSVARILTDGSPGDVELAAICNRNVEKKRVDWVPDGVNWTSDFEAILQSDVEIIIELLEALSPPQT